MTQHYFASYRQNQLLTASPTKLLLTAFDGAIRFCRIGGEKMSQGNLEEQSANLNKALGIVAELLSALNEQANPPLVANLKSLYAYVIEKIAHANLNQDPIALQEALGILLQLRETWSQADQLLQQDIGQEEAA